MEIGTGFVLTASRPVGGSGFEPGALIGGCGGAETLAVVPVRRGAGGRQPVRGFGGYQSAARRQHAQRPERPGTGHVCSVRDRAKAEDRDGDLHHRDVERGEREHRLRSKHDRSAQRDFDCGQSDQSAEHDRRSERLPAGAEHGRQDQRDDPLPGARHVRRGQDLVGLPRVLKLAVPGDRRPRSCL